MMSDVVRIAEERQKRAWEIVREAGIVEIWTSFGAQVNLVGSLRTGLLISNRDVDFHIYTRPFRLSDSFAAIAGIAGNGKVRKIAYENRLGTEEKCVEWHAWYEAGPGETWQIDMIHILYESRYAGWFEKVAGRIRAVLTDETRQAILSIKNAMPEGKKVAGIRVCMAVIRDGVRTYEEFEDWERRNRDDGIISWIP